MAQWGWSSLQIYELAVSRYYLQACQGIGNEALKVGFCAAYFLGVFLVNLLLVPCWLVIGALCMYSADAEGAAATAVAEQQRRHGVRGLLKLYDWAVGAVEAPVSAALLIMLLVQGINSSSGYFVETPLILYSSLMFSVIHMLSFIWEMLFCLVMSTSHDDNSLAAWKVSLLEPFALLMPEHGLAACVHEV